MAYFGQPSAFHPVHPSDFFAAAPPFGRPQADVFSRFDPALAAASAVPPAMAAAACSLQQYLQAVNQPFHGFGSHVASLSPAAAAAWFGLMTCPPPASLMAGVPANRFSVDTILGQQQSFETGSRPIKTEVSTPPGIEHIMINVYYLSFTRESCIVM